MKSVTETIFFDSDIAPDLFGQYAIQIGDRDWWDLVGIEPPSLAENRSGMMCIRAGRLVALVAGILRAWSVSDEDALRILLGTGEVRFETIVDRARMILLGSSYSALSFSSELKSPNTWFRRPSPRWDGLTPLDVMIEDAIGVQDVFQYLEATVSPVTYFMAEHDN